MSSCTVLTRGYFTRPHKHPSADIVHATVHLTASLPIQPCQMNWIAGRRGNGLGHIYHLRTVSTRPAGLAPRSARHKSLPLGCVLLEQAEKPASTPTTHAILRPQASTVHSTVHDWHAEPQAAQCIQCLVALCLVTVGGQWVVCRSPRSHSLAFYCLLDCSLQSHHPPSPTLPSVPWLAWLPSLVVYLLVGSRAAHWHWHLISLTRSLLHIPLHRFFLLLSANLS